MKSFSLTLHVHLHLSSKLIHVAEKGSCVQKRQERLRIYLRLSLKHSTYMSWQALGWEVGVDAGRKAIQTTCFRERIVDAIAAQKPLVSAHDAKKRVERTEGQLATHGSWTDWKQVLFNDEVHF
jgi:hypothetical protein